MAGPSIELEIDELIHELNQRCANIIMDNAANQVDLLTFLMRARFANFLRELDQEIQNSGQEMSAITERIAAEAQKAILEQYDDTWKHTPRYRLTARRAVNIRYAGGIIRGVLADSDFVKGTAAGIDMGPVAVLDKAAKQWQRLNYGAEPDGARGGESIQARISNIDVTWDDPTGPRPAFVLPAGRWISGAFYPTSELPKGFSAGGRVKKDTPTRGITAMHWSDAGARVIVTQIGPAMVQMLAEMWDRAVTSGVSQSH